MRKAILLVGLATLVACESDISFVRDDSSVNQAVLATWLTALTGLPGNTPSAAGNVELDEYGSYMLVDGSFTGLEPDTLYEWRIWRGSCDAPHTVYGANAGTPALSDLVTSAAGAATGGGTVSGRLQADSIYNVRVFRVQGEDDDTLWAACGDSQRQ